MAAFVGHADQPDHPPPMIDVTSLAIADVKLIRAKIFFDPRGHFVETYSRRHYAAAGIACEFVQDNCSLSTRIGTVRGLHFQLPNAAQAKLVRVLAGAVFDVAVDIRRGSPTYGRWCGITLTARGGEQTFVPRGFAHGFCTLEPDTQVAYKVDAYYAPDRSRGLAWNDPDIAIRWPAEANDPCLSESDARLPPFAGFDSPFCYEGK
jgi:dTDP-4-dehydrorhamnose 3,5-epimerase